MGGGETEEEKEWMGAVSCWGEEEFVVVMVGAKEEGDEEGAVVDKGEGEE